MKQLKMYIVTFLFLFIAAFGLAQSVSKSTFWKPDPANYTVKKAFEIEAVPFVYFSEGYHLSVGYRYKKLRFRISTINAGTYNSETSNDEYERFETKGTFGFFAGYNVWKNLETYVFVDRQVFDIKQKASSEIKELKTVSPGIGVGYQFFIGRSFYIQPAVHLYLRSEESVSFTNNATYKISTTDITPVLRIGFRPWKKF
jgi:hypothetical protein